MQGLLDRGSGTPKARDDARTRRDVAAARLKGAREALARLKNGSRPEEMSPPAPGSRCPTPASPSSTSSGRTPRSSAPRPAW